MEISNECFKTNTGENYCTNENKKLKTYANGKLVEDIAGYMMEDLDRILLTYGTEENLEKELSSVGDMACMYSEICPERGTPPTESCVGGIGSFCQ